VVGKPIPAPAVPIRDAEKKEYLDEQATNGLSVQVQNVNGQISMAMSRGRSDGDRDRDAIEGTEWPETKPPTTGALFAAPDGSVWVERSRPAKAPRSYDVVSTTGQPARRVVLPPDRRVVAVGARGVYVKYIDDNGISYLERYESK
jgi:hypothetical protein